LNTSHSTDLGRNRSSKFVARNETEEIISKRNSGRLESKEEERGRERKREKERERERETNKILIM
jgi:hypothetical protein